MRQSAFGSLVKWWHRFFWSPFWSHYKLRHYKLRCLLVCLSVCLSRDHGTTCHGTTGHGTMGHGKQDSTRAKTGITARTTGLCRGATGLWATGNPHRIPHRNYTGNGIPHRIPNFYFVLFILFPNFLFFLNKPQRNPRMSPWILPQISPRISPQILPRIS